jgi:hypothetical protein
MAARDGPERLRAITRNTHREGKAMHHHYQDQNADDFEDPAPEDARQVAVTILAMASLFPILPPILLARATYLLELAAPQGVTN